jgi:hypothetical protein
MKIAALLLVLFCIACNDNVPTKTAQADIKVDSTIKQIKYNK